MNNSPILLLVGKAGSGKDTVAGFMVKNHGAQAVAHADPMKRLAKLVFGFTDDQLWGPSELRNAPDTRFTRTLPLREPVDEAAREQWDDARDRLYSRAVDRWLIDILELAATDVPRVLTGLQTWFNNLQDQCWYASNPKPLSPRLVLQTLGTEWGRAQGRDIWSSYTIRVAFELLCGSWRYDRATGLIHDPAAVGPKYVVITDGRFRNEVVNVLRVGGQAIRIDSPSIDSTAVEKAGIAGHVSETEQGGIPTAWFKFLFCNDKSKGLTHCEERVKFMMYFAKNTHSGVGYPEGQSPNTEN